MSSIFETTNLRQVNVFIMEDDFYYNDLLAKKIYDWKEGTKLKKHLTIKIKQFNKAEDFLQSVQNAANNNSTTIALIDYFLGYGINGMHLVHLLTELKMNIKVILMSQSDKVISELDHALMRRINLIKLRKHHYTPDICCTIIENYINNI